MSFNFTFGDISNASILQFDPKCLIVATPEGTPSPPDVTSTVARPLLSQGRRKAVGFSNFLNKLNIVEVDEDDDDDEDVEVEVNESYVQPSQKKKVQFPIKSGDQSGHVSLLRSKISNKIDSLQLYIL